MPSLIPNQNTAREIAFSLHADVPFAAYTKQELASDAEKSLFKQIEYTVELIEYSSKSKNNSA